MVEVEEELLTVLDVLGTGRVTIVIIGAEVMLEAFEAGVATGGGVSTTMLLLSEAEEGAGSGKVTIVGKDIAELLALAEDDTGAGKVATVGGREVAEVLVYGAGRSGKVTIVLRAGTVAAAEVDVLVIAGVVAAFPGKFSTL
jgi:hypothetical protein